MPIQIVKRWVTALPFASRPALPSKPRSLKVRKSMLKSTDGQLLVRAHSAIPRFSRERLIQQFKDGKLQRHDESISAIRLVTNGVARRTRHAKVWNEEWNTGRRRCGQVARWPVQRE